MYYIALTLYILKNNKVIKKIFKFPSIKILLINNKDIQFIIRYYSLHNNIQGYCLQTNIVKIQTINT